MILKFHIFIINKKRFEVFWKKIIINRLPTSDVLRKNVKSKFNLK